MSVKIKVIFVDLGGVLIVNKAKEVGEKYQKLAKLTPKVTKKIWRFIQTGKRSKEELKVFLNSQNIDIQLWSKFTNEFYKSEFRNNKLVELLEKAKGIDDSKANCLSARKLGLQAYKYIYSPSSIKEISEIIDNQ
jgi:FMN phosphatase YigB (HAD superfamily)